MIDDYDTLSVVPLIVKSGKDYMIHSALNKFVTNESYNLSFTVVVLKKIH